VEQTLKEFLDRSQMLIKRKKKLKSLVWFYWPYILKSGSSLTAAIAKRRE
jgi:hypothetical protein